LKRTLFYILSAFSLFDASAQSLDTLKMSVISIPQTSYKNVEQYDSMIVQDPFLSIAELLTNSSSVQVNNQGGKGAISSVSIRGYSSSQTSVKWNGLSINSLTLGMYDFGGVQSGIVDQVRIYKGNSVSDLNDVSVGGVIVLENKINWKDTFHVQLGSEVGSFGYVGNQFKIGGVKKRFYFELKTSLLKAENEFTYENHKKIGLPKEVQKNATFKNTNIVFSSGWRNKKLKIENHTWVSSKRIEVPKIYTDSKTSVAFSQDSTIRSVFNFYSFIKGLKIKGFYGINHERFLYNDSAFGINTHYVLNNNHFNLVAKHNYKQWDFEYLNELQVQFANNNQFEGVKNRLINLTKSKIERSLFNSKLTLSGTGAINKIWSPNKLVPSGVLGYYFNWHNLLLKGSGGTHFRVGSFNDLFWPTGGNINLEPEKGWNFEQSFEYSRTIKKMKLTVFGEAYHSIINDWIQWRPNGSFSSADNLKKVNAKGGEAILKFMIPFKNGKLKMSSQYALTKAITLESDLERDPSIGNQIIYVPLHQNKNQLSFDFKGFKGVYALNYFGLRHTTGDNVLKKALDSYWIQDLHVNKKWDFKLISIYAKFSILNLSNQFYEGVSNRPMPGRAYYFTLFLNYN
jgi:hypothetical protein